MVLSYLVLICVSRPPELRIGRTSAPENEDMVMSGLRMPRKGGGGSGSHFGKYAGDTGVHQLVAINTCCQEIGTPSFIHVSDCSTKLSSICTSTDPIHPKALGG